MTIARLACCQAGVLGTWRKESRSNTAYGLHLLVTMVESQPGDQMVDGNQIEQRLTRVENKVDALAESVDAGLREQREYTEFAFGRLRSEMREGFGRIERKLDQFIDTQARTNELVERRLARLESR
jgi:hypothetical protein